MNSRFLKRLALGGASMLVGLGLAIGLTASELAESGRAALPGEINLLMVEKGVRTGIQIEDQSRREAGLIKVAVNRPGSAVTLILSSPQPAVWHLGWSEGSRVAAVVTIGPYAQMAAGLPDDVPVTHLTAPTTQGRALNESDLRKIILETFGREPERVIESNNGYLTVGEAVGRDQPLFTASAFDPEQFRLPGVPRADTEGLLEAVRKGWIKPITIGEMLPCSKNPERVTPVLDEYGVYTPDYGWVNDRYYLVVSPEFAFPVGLHGAHSAAFYIAEGLDKPRGDPGHSKVVFLSTCAQEGSLR